MNRSTLINNKNQVLGVMKPIAIPWGTVSATAILSTPGCKIANHYWFVSINIFLV